jgi:hypothetical protein
MTIEFQMSVQNELVVAARAIFSGNSDFSVYQIDSCKQLVAQGLLKISGEQYSFTSSGFAKYIIQFTLGQNETISAYHHVVLLYVLRESGVPLRKSELIKPLRHQLSLVKAKTTVASFDRVLKKLEEEAYIEYTKMKPHSKYSITPSGEDKLDSSIANLYRKQQAR